MLKYYDSIRVISLHINLHVEELTVIFSRGLCSPSTSQNLKIMNMYNTSETLAKSLQKPHTCIMFKPQVTSTLDLFCITDFRLMIPSVLTSGSEVCTGWTGVPGPGLWCVPLTSQRIALSTPGALFVSNLMQSPLCYSALPRYFILLYMCFTSYLSSTKLKLYFERNCFFTG